MHCRHFLPVCFRPLLGPIRPVTAGRHAVLETPRMSERVSLWSLFTTFLKIGSTAFGGFMALISVVQN
jgi:hypothetical protein